jgi:(p)ppGpp synthase/HD superfamily hydrolase
MDQADLSALDPRQLARAVELAASLHAEQKRKLTGAPYLGHLFRVAGLVLEFGGGQEEVVAALLHDAVEDQGGMETYHRIREQFGTQVADLVLQLSDSAGFPRPPWEERKKRFLDSLRTASLAVQRIVLCDKIDNLRQLLSAYDRWGETVWQKFRGGRDGTLWYHREILKILEEGPHGSALQAGLVEYRDLVGKLELLASSAKTP